MTAAKKTILVLALSICFICMTIASVIAINELIHVGFRQLSAEDKIMVFIYPLLSVSTIVNSMNIVRKCK